VEATERDHWDRFVRDFAFRPGRRPAFLPPVPSVTWDLPPERPVKRLVTDVARECGPHLVLTVDDYLVVVAHDHSWGVVVDRDEPSLTVFGEPAVTVMAKRGRCVFTRVLRATVST
jgi:Protein of unknown function (DUF2716)